MKIWNATIQSCIFYDPQLPSVHAQNSVHDMKQQILNEYTNELDYVEKFYNYVQMNFFLGVLH